MLTRRRILGVKVETTPGTAVSLSADDAALIVYDAEMQPTAEFQERQGPGFSPIPGVVGARGGTCTFKTDLYGSGVAATVPLWASRLLPACGFRLVEPSGLSPYFTPDSRPPEASGSGTHTVTLGLWQDGVYKRLAGCQGTFKITCPAGQLAQVEWTFTGVWVAPSDAALPAPTYPSVSPLRFASAALALGGSAWSPRVSELGLDVGMEVKLREDANEASGYCFATIVNRRIVGSLDPESTLVAENDPHADWLASTEQTLEFTLGSAAGNRIVIAAPCLQWTNVQGADRDGIRTDALEFQLNRNADAGDDELTLTFD